MKPYILDSLVCSIVVLGCFLFSGCATKASFTPSAGPAPAAAPHSAAHIIIPEGRFMRGFRPGDTAWPLTEANFLACEVALGNELKKTHKNIEHYYLRVYGVVREGKHVVIGMAGHKQGSNSEAYLRPPTDGSVWDPGWGLGDYHFDFEYDCDLNILTRFQFGAGA